MRMMAKGEGKAGCIFWGLLALTVAFVAFEAVPVQVSKMKLEDQIKEVAMTNPRITVRQFEKQILGMTRELDLPLDKRNLKIRKTRKKVWVDLEMVVPLDLRVTEYDWHIEISVERDLFYF
ncbi:MAG: hypothetical protein AAF725_00160 [Acidobacteriota bacterium]